MNVIIKQDVLVSKEQAAEAFADVLVAGLSKVPGGLKLGETTARDLVDSVVEHSWACSPESMMKQIGEKLRLDHGREELETEAVLRAINLGARYVQRRLNTGEYLGRRWSRGNPTALFRYLSMGSTISRGWQPGGIKMIIISDLPEALSQLLLKRAGIPDDGNFTLVTLEDRATAYGRVIGKWKTGVDPLIEYAVSEFEKGATLKLAFDREEELSSFSAQLRNTFTIDEILVDRSKDFWSEELERKLLAGTVTA